MAEPGSWARVKNAVREMATGGERFQRNAYRYRWIPNTHVPWPAAFWAALVVASLWQIAAKIFAWYVSSGLASYQLVYGSLGAIIALIFWIHLAGWFTIFGAHLSAAVARDGSPSSKR